MIFYLAANLKSANFGRCNITSAFVLAEKANKLSTDSEFHIYKASLLKHTHVLYIYLNMVCTGIGRVITYNRTSELSM